MDQPNTLTEAQARSRLLVVLSNANSSSSNFRNIPYAERYQAATAAIETPVEQIQRAARDEEQRKTESEPEEA